MIKNNTKTIITKYNNSFVKSNKIAMATLNKKLSLNQMQLLSYAIYCTQHNRSSFRKYEFQKQYRINQYRSSYVKRDLDALFDLKISNIDIENEYMDYIHVFQRITYDKGIFSFIWSDAMLSNITDVNDNYVLTDISIVSNFKSSYSWILYDYLRAHFGYWHKYVTKSDLMAIFNAKSKSYKNNTLLFKNKVLDVAISEINKYTEINVHYKELRKGREITGFNIFWSSGKKLKSATDRQINEIKLILDTINQKMFDYIDRSSNKNKSVEIIRACENYRLFLSDDVSITYDIAHDILIKSKNALNILELLVDDYVKKIEKPVAFYNWLEER